MKTQPARHAFPKRQQSLRSSSTVNRPARRTLSFSARSRRGTQRTGVNTGRSQTPNVNKPTRLSERQWLRTLQFIIFFIVIMAFVSTHVFFLFIVPRVKTITCQQADGTACSAQLTEALSTRRGQLLYLLSANQLQTQLQQLEPDILSIQVERQIPTTVRITVHKEQPLFLIKKDDQHYAVFPSKKMLPTQPGDQQPVIQISTELLGSNSQLTAEEFEAFRQLAEFEWQPLTVSSIVVLDPNLIEVTTSKKILLTLADLSQQLPTLKTILQQPALFEQEWTELDLRFDKPVVRYEVKESSAASEMEILGNE